MVKSTPKPRKKAKSSRPKRGVAIDGPRPVDVHVGSRLRLRRTLLGISQEKLGDAVDLTFQQIQKYERGANRIGASRLYEFCSFLDVPVSYFFDEMPRDIKASKGRPMRGLSDQAQERLESDPMTKRETLELVRAYYKISSPLIRKRIFELIKSIGTLNRG